MPPVPPLPGLLLHHCRVQLAAFANSSFDCYGQQQAPHLHAWYNLLTRSALLLFCLQALQKI
jgi:hypothetical protein